MRRQAIWTAGAAVPYAAVAAGLYGAGSAWAAILAYHLGLVAALSLLGWRESVRRAAAGWRLRSGALWAAVTALGGAALYVLWPHVDATPHGLGARLSQFGLEETSWVLFAAYYSTVHPLLEELFWRGWPQPGGAASVWRDAAFAGYHVPVLWFFISPVWIGASFAVLVAASWMWWWASRRSGGLGVVLISHAAADASIVIAASAIVWAG